MQEVLGLVGKTSPARMPVCRGALVGIARAAFLVSLRHRRRYTTAQVTARGALAQNQAIPSILRKHMLPVEIVHLVPAAMKGWPAIIKRNHAFAVAFQDLANVHARNSGNVDVDVKYGKSFRVGASRILPAL